MCVCTYLLINTCKNTTNSCMGLSINVFLALNVPTHSHSCKHTHKHTHTSPNQLSKFGEVEPHGTVPIATVSPCNCLCSSFRFANVPQWYKLQAQPSFFTVWEKIRGRERGKERTTQNIQDSFFSLISHCLSGTLYWKQRKIEGEMGLCAKLGLDDVAESSLTATNYTLPEGLV